MNKSPSEILDEIRARAKSPPLVNKKTGGRRNYSLDALQESFSEPTKEQKTVDDFDRSMGVI